VDIDSLAGQSNVVFRFRVGTDGSAGAPGWDIDNVTVQGCSTVLEYADGFENTEN
jgi:ABC-type transporter MlaC component